MIRKTVILFFLGLVVSFYTAFVLMRMWNWFMTVAFHVTEISWWVMYGLVLMVSLFEKPTDRSLTDETRWKSALLMIHACVPEARKADVKEDLHALIPTEWEIWTDVALDLFGRVVTNTLTLGVGFAVHSLT